LRRKRCHRFLLPFFCLYLKWKTWRHKHVVAFFFFPFFLITNKGMATNLLSSQHFPLLPTSPPH
jgi:hypothetical protein